MNDDSIRLLGYFVEGLLKFAPLMIILWITWRLSK